MKTKLDDKQMQELAEHLQGTVMSFSEGFRQVFGDMPVPELDEEDAEARIEEFGTFLCGICGWWCEEDELAETDDSDRWCTDCDRDAKYEDRE